jgi:hypothetical protein
MSENITINLEGLSKEEREQLLGLVEKAKRPKKIWKPKCGEWYWFVRSDGEVNTCKWENDHIDLGRHAMGNCFRTKGEATFAREKQKIKTELQRFADEHNDLEKLEWDVEGIHYDIVIEYKEGHKKGLVTQPAFTFRGMDCVYFTSKEIADVAVQTIGKERILKYMFDIESEEEE